MDFMQQTIADILDWLNVGEQQNLVNIIITILAAVGGFLLWFFGVLKWFFGLFKRGSGAGDTGGVSISVGHGVGGDVITGGTKAAGGAAAVGGNVGGNVTIGYTSEQHEAALQKRLDELRADLERAHAAERDLLLSQITEVERQKSDLEASFTAREQDLRELRLKLADVGEGIAGERIEAAQQALDEGDTSLADTIFAEVETMDRDAIDRAANAAFQRGRIAEDEVRWAGAAEHYGRAAGLDPSYDALFKAREFAWRAGDYTRAAGFGEDLIRVARREFGDESAELAVALNGHALTIAALGRYAEAEPLYRQALEIGAKTIGTAHPDCASGLSNLATLLKNMGRHAEAEPLYAQALEIFRAKLGPDHPDTKTVEANYAAFVAERDAAPPE